MIRSISYDSSETGDISKKSSVDCGILRLGGWLRLLLLTYGVRPRVFFLSTNAHYTQELNICMCPLSAYVHAYIYMDIYIYKYIYIQYICVFMCVLIRGDVWMSEWNDRWDLLFSCLVHKISVFVNDEEARRSREAARRSSHNGQ